MFIFLFRVPEFYTLTRLFFGEIRWVKKNKKPVNTAFHGLSNIINRLKVEVRRIELLSKHILQKLSTCLFAY